MLDQLRTLAPSIIRTVTPWLVGLIVAGLARVGLDWTPSDTALGAIAWAVSTLYYAGIRWLETHASPEWGWLLGLPGAPVYTEPPASDAAGGA